MTFTLNREKTLARYVLPTAFIVVALILALKFGASIWLSGQRQQLEQGLSKASGMQARIKGDIGATLLPTPGVSLGEIELTGDGKPTIKIRQFHTDFELWPLFNKRFVPHAVNVYGLDLQIKQSSAALPLPALLQKPADAGKTGLRPDFGFELPDQLQVHESTIVIRSTDGKVVYALKNFNFTVLPVREKAALLKPGKDSWLFSLYLNFKQAQLGPLVVGPSIARAEYGPYRLSIAIQEATVLGGTGNGTVTWLSATETPGIKANFVLNNFDADKSVTLFRPTAFVHGKLDLQADFSSAGKKPVEWLANLAGTVRLTGTNIDLVTIDLDKLISSVIKSQGYNLADAMAYFFIGPMGATATKGVDVAGVATEALKPGTKPNQIKQLVSAWKIKDGIAAADDVALKTDRYHLALQGNIKLPKQEFDNVRIAVVNQRGCAIASQKLKGPVASPKLEKTNLLISLAKPLIKLPLGEFPIIDVLLKSAKQGPGEDCKPFYTGELLTAATPKESKKAQ